MKLLIARHGETDVNATGGLHLPGEEIGLNKTGKNQALNLVELFKKENVEVLYSSPALRARQTAEIIGKALNIPIVIIKGLNERNWGEWHSKAWLEIEEYLNNLSFEERFVFVPPGGESWQEMEGRLNKCLSKILKKPHESVGIITHAGVIRALIPILKKEPKEKNVNYNLKNGEVKFFVGEKSTFLNPI